MGREAVRFGEGSSEIIRQAKLCCEEDPFTIETSDAVMWCNDAWNALDADTIKACWRHAGLYVDRTQIGDIIN
ncbi:hypothetical protein GN958_ATG16962 [Phytophthora infestans]|uniref:DDE-1 domain-containing protein n=1 Tax=Phytophthora infestans TaxID=4787 RepID=A0A8S9TXW9_PHYIN|nr:hypothetical protein GN958_ATG16962 [Phytophthora infestans]